MFTLTRGHKIVIIVLIGAILIGIAIYLLYREFNPSEPEVLIDLPPGGAAEQRVIQYEPPTLNETDKAKNTIRNLSLLFAERFGTYSNQNNDQSFVELEKFMTEGFYNWTTTQYQDKLGQEFSNSGNYSAILTQALAVEFKSLTDNNAQVSVTTLRTKNSLGSDSLKYYQDLQLDFVKINNSWRIDAAYWEAI